MSWPSLRFSKSHRIILVYIAHVCSKDEIHLRTKSQVMFDLDGLLYDLWPNLHIDVTMLNVSWPEFDTNWISTFQINPYPTIGMLNPHGFISATYPTRIPNTPYAVSKRRERFLCKLNLLIKCTTYSNIFIYVYPIVTVYSFKCWNWFALVFRVPFVQLVRMYLIF